MGNHKAGVIAALSLAGRRIGFARGHRREPSSARLDQPAGRAARDPRRGPHAVAPRRPGSAAEPADFGPAKLFREEPAAARELLAAHPEPFALLHPGAGWANKRYPPAWWGKATRLLQAETGLPTWVAAARGEEGLAAEVAAASGGAARAVPAGDLPTLAALIRRARLMLGGDSGPSHLARALGTPLVMVMGPTDPERHGPYGAPETAVFKRLPCSFCYQRLAETKACLLEVPPRWVAARAVDLLRR